MDTPTGGDSSANQHLVAQALEQFNKSPQVLFVWTVGKVLATAFVSGAIAVGVGYMRDMRDDMRTVMNRLADQDKAQALLAQRVESLQRQSDASTAVVQDISVQVEHNTDAIVTMQQGHRAR